ncbi:hypothetical protein ACU686_31750 [Yinghuangia aomiensis]
MPSRRRPVFDPCTAARRAAAGSSTRYRARRSTGDAPLTAHLPDALFARCPPGLGRPGLAHPTAARPPSDRRQEVPCAATAVSSTPSWTRSEAHCCTPPTC